MLDAFLGIKGILNHPHFLTGGLRRAGFAGRSATLPGELAGIGPWICRLRTVSRPGGGPGAWRARLPAGVEAGGAAGVLSGVWLRAVSAWGAAGPGFGRLSQTSG